MDYNPLGSSVHGARILEWIAMPFSRGSSQPRDWTWVSHIAGRLFTVWATRKDHQGHLVIKYLDFFAHCWSTKVCILHHFLGPPRIHSNFLWWQLSDVHIVYFSGFFPLSQRCCWRLLFSISSLRNYFCLKPCFSIWFWWIWIRQNCYELCCKLETKQ